ncbi:hypothetical protein T4A_5846 [Trichinella pseudospiralis]|uniref:Uncharacterized protein n=1 Tax=Trichinella pseudospiralis TaxID=6337 RepID=A0A0V1DR63_TRIPS|nr:hypothetical protein T4A_5846 [Trichinella pseudospiralis]
MIYEIELKQSIEWDRETSEFNDNPLQVNQQKEMCERRETFKMAWNQQIVYGRTTCR